MYGPKTIHPAPSTNPKLLLPGFLSDTLVLRAARRFWISTACVLNVVAQLTCLLGHHIISHKLHHPPARPKDVPFVNNEGRVTSYESGSSEATAAAAELAGPLANANDQLAPGDSGKHETGVQLHGTRVPTSQLPPVYKMFLSRDARESWPSSYVQTFSMGQLPPIDIWTLNMGGDCMISIYYKLRTQLVASH